MISVHLDPVSLSALAAAALAALLPALWLEPDGTPRRVLVALAWMAAVAILVLNCATTPLNDDEVFYLVESQAAARGETAGALPLRYLVFRPFLLPGLGPSSTVRVSRAAMVLLGLACGLLAGRAASRLAAPRLGWLIGALALLWLTSWAGLAFLRPEYFAAAALLTAFALLVAPPTAWSGRRSAFVAGVAVAVAASISHRQAFFVVPFLAVVGWGTEGRFARLGAAAAGLAAGALPSLAYVLFCDSFASVWYWNWTFVQQTQWAGPREVRAEFPLFLFCLALVGAGRGLAGAAGPAAVPLFWTASTLLLMALPLGTRYARGPWLSLSLLAVATLLGSALRPNVRRSAVAAALALVAVPGLRHPLGAERSVETVQSNVEMLGSQLALLDWLGEVSRGGAVACVAPYHPLRAPNAWRLWNPAIYGYVKDPYLNRALNPGQAALLEGASAAVIAWDPWPRTSGARTVLAHAVDRGLIPVERMDALVAALHRNYRLVQWAGPLPPDHGRGRFLVRKDLRLDTRVLPVAESRLARWR